MQLKLIPILLLGVLCNFSLYGQSAATPPSDRITVSFSNARLSEAIGQIEKNSRYTFFYDTQNTDLTQRVSLAANDMPVADALARMLSGTNLDFEITNNQIALFARKPGSTVTGTVLDSRSVPLAGVAVIVGDTNAGTVTDAKGKFSLQAASFPAKLTFSFLGFKTQVVNVSADVTDITVYLVDDVYTMDDVVVVGYGTQKKVNLTGAVSTLESSQLRNRASHSVTHMLQGTIPGVNVSTSSGLPGNEPSINIRGITSINGGKPLVLIDGFEGELGKVNPNDIESISVLKDASAAAVYGTRGTYGVVLVTTKSVIIDPESQQLQTTVSYSGRWGVGKPTTSTDYETRGYYSVWLNDMFMKSYSGNNYTKYTEADYDELWARRNDKTEHPDRPWVVIDQRTGKNTYVYYGNTDWYHYLYKDTRPTQSHDISLSGGNSKVQYYLSGNFYSEEGVIRNNPDKFQKINFRSKVGFDVNKWIKVSNNTSYYNKKYFYPGPSPMSTYFSLDKVHALASLVPVNPDGTSVYSTALMDYTIMDGLPAIVNNGLHTNNDYNDYMSTTTQLEYRPVKGLTFIGNFTYSFNHSTYQNRQVNVDYSMYPGEISTLTTGRFENKLTENSNKHNYYAVNAYGTYETVFNKNHNFKVVAGYNWETKMLKDVKAIGYNLFSDVLSDLNLVGQTVDGEKRTEVSGGFNEYVVAGFFGRVNYDYKGRYLFEASGRYDGTSRFGRDYRWGFYPSFSAGWRISEESFFEPAKNTVDNLKLRFSYGSLGNQQVGYYDYIRQISTSTLGDYIFGGGKTIHATIGAPVAGNLTWERAEHTNLGIDLAMFNSRLSFTGDFYIRDTKDMLAPSDALPGVYGAAAPKNNSADLRTKGYELTLGWRDHFKVAGKPFSYNVTLMFSDYITEITKYDNNPDKLISSKPYYVGQRWGEIWGLQTDGYFLSDEEAANWHIDQRSVNAIIISSAGAEKGLRAGDIKFRDLDGDDEITIGKDMVGDSGDYRIIGNSEPRYHYGINLGAAWNGIDFSVFFQGVGRRDWYPAANAMAFWGPYARPYSTYIPKDFHQDIWSEENPNAYYPRPRGYVALQGTNRELTVKNDKYLQNIGYCRLKNLTVGYTLPYKWTSKLLIENLRVHFTGENLVTWTKLRSDYIDPEQAAADDLARTYPYQKMFIFGIDITF